MGPKNRGCNVVPAVVELVPSLHEGDRKMTDLLKDSYIQATLAGN